MSDAPKSRPEQFRAQREDFERWLERHDRRVLWRLVLILFGLFFLHLAVDHWLPALRSR